MATKTTNTTTKDNLDTQLALLKTTSGKVRFLDAQGMTRGAIAKKLGIRYQWVRNVLVTPVTKAKEQI